MKQYVKPDLLVENFELSKHIATCTWDVNVMVPDDCVAKSDGNDVGIPGGLTVFANRQDCVFTDFEDYCYTNGPAELNVYNS